MKNDNLFGKIFAGVLGLAAIVLLAGLFFKGRCDNEHHINGTPGKIVKFIGPASVGDSSLDEGGATGVVASKSVNATAVALVDGASIATDASTSNLFTVTLAGNRTLANPTNLTTGGTYTWVVSQDIGGSRTLAYGTTFTWPSGVACLLSTAPNAVDVISAVYDGTKLRAVCSKTFL
jgi:hypothetical protein